MHLLPETQHRILEVLNLGFFKSWIIKKIDNRRRANSRRGDYGRIVAYVEEKYGIIDQNDPIFDVQDKFERALQSASVEKGDKYLAGFKSYVKQQRYKYLIREEN